MSKIVSAREAVDTIRDGSTIAVCGCENIIVPEKVLSELEKRFLETGHPRDITDIHAVTYGMGVGLGLEHLSHEGLLRHSIGSGFSYLKTSKMAALVRENKIQAHVLPMGTVFQILTGTASGEKYTFNKVGFDTFVDSGIEGGCMNKATENTMCRRVEILGEQYLCYENPKVDVALLRGTTVDELGNLSVEEEPMNTGLLTLAMAAKASGGKVIVQAKRLCSAKSIAPRRVMVPGIFVDMIVIDGEQAPSGGALMNPALTGEIRMPASTLEPMPLNIQKLISRRAAREITTPRTIVNLGVGIPVNIPMILNEDGSELETVFFPEHGSIGGIPGERSIFGTNINPEAIIDHTNVFHYFRGTGLDMSFLGFGEIDADGNVNVSNFSGIVPGCGGFIDIAHRTPKLVFCGSFTAGGLELEIGGGKLAIKSEGKFGKLVKKVQQITLNGKSALKKGQSVKYVTERCVFQLTDKGLKLIECAPGIDVQKDIIDLIPFPVIVDNPAPMDAALFTE